MESIFIFLILMAVIAADWLIRGLPPDQGIFEKAIFAGLLFFAYKSIIKRRKEPLEFEKFKMAVDNVSDQIIITDPEGMTLYVNKAIEKITGYKAGEAVGQKAGALWKLPMDKAFYRKMWKTIREDKETFEGEVRNRRKNGEIYDAHISISPVLDRNNNIVFFVGIERDVTEEKRIEAAKTEFVSLASHQLRTPLTGINWYTELILSEDSGSLNDKQKMFAEEIYKSSQRMVELVEMLLNLSRIEMGRLAVNPVNIDMKGVAEESIKDLTSQIKEKKIALKTEYGKIPETSADPQLIKIIFQNLLSNSIKYTGEKGEVSLNVGVSEQYPDSMVIKVSDNGYGIPENQKDKIFEKFFRADNIREKESEGTGLGLYIVKLIVENIIGGKIWFDSEEGKGSDFYVLLPLSGMKKKEGTKSLIN